MKYFTLLFIPVLFLFSSCNMEKRVYRNGWYKENHHDVHQYSTTLASTTADENSAAVVSTGILKPVALQQKDSALVLSKDSSAVKEKLTVASVYKRAEKKITGDDDPKKKKMTYGEAKKSMAEKGCKADPLVTTVYWMAWGSVASVWFGFGLLLCIATLILCIFADDNAAASGNCADENLAIVEDARHICILTLIWTLIIFALVLLLVLGIVAIAAANGAI
ncbi:MAG: hypothetical protein HY064_07720 [Bacteroidetes bacterium]|nr:hypothetical protein [Bacteroidota bacterium]